MPTDKKPKTVKPKINGGGVGPSKPCGSNKPHGSNKPPPENSTEQKLEARKKLLRQIKQQIAVISIQIQEMNTINQQKRSELKEKKTLRDNKNKDLYNSLFLIPNLLKVKIDKKDNIMDFYRIMLGMTEDYEDISDNVNIIIKYIEYFHENYFYIDSQASYVPKPPSTPVTRTISRETPKK